MDDSFDNMEAKYNKEGVFMGLRINTNVASLNAQNNLKISSDRKEAALQKMSSGLRINKAADDAAGLAISENLKASIRGNQQATRNANDGVSLIQVAEGGMNEVSNILIRLRELSVQAASDTIGNTERGFINIEVNQLKEEVGRISNVTRFNDTKLLNGEAGQIEVQVGTSNNIAEDRLQLDLANTNVGPDALGIGGLDFSEKSSAQDAMGSIDAAITSVNANRANLGAIQNRLQSTISNLAVSSENLAASNSRIRDADLAVESSELVKQSILQQSGTSVLAQANMNSQSVLKLIG
jgi:flagellin